MRNYIYPYKCLPKQDDFIKEHMWFGAKICSSEVHGHLPGNQSSPFGTICAKREFSASDGEGECPARGVGAASHH